MARAQQDDPDLLNSSLLQLCAVPVPTSDTTSLCDMSTGTPRPYVPQLFRPTCVYNANAPRCISIQSLLLVHFQGIFLSSNMWTILLAGLKLFRSPTSQQLQLLMPSSLVGSHCSDLTVRSSIYYGIFLSSNMWTILLAGLKLFRSPTSQQLQLLTPSSLVGSHCSDLTVPSTITTDHGAQFESNLWTQLMRLLGSNRIQTTAYHPAANGLVERLHRQLKATLSAVLQTQWLDALSLVLLGFRSCLKEDLHCTSLRLPGSYSPTLHHATTSSHPRITSHILYATHQ